MPSASIKKEIPCSKENLIKLVLDIEKYPEFVPWCLNGKIHSKKEKDDKVEIINNSVKIFDVSVNDQLAGNINLALGGFIKWHFIYHDVHNFLRLFFCVFMSIFLIYLIKTTQ